MDSASPLVDPSPDQCNPGSLAPGPGLGNELDLTILQALEKRTQSSKISRRKLLVRLQALGFTGLNDRYMRARIEHLRRHDPLGARICANRGYWIARSLNELTASIEREERRAKATLYTNKRRRKMARHMLEGGKEFSNMRSAQ